MILAQLFDAVILLVVLALSLDVLRVAVPGRDPWYITGCLLVAFGAFTYLTAILSGRVPYWGAILLHLGLVVYSALVHHGLMLKCKRAAKCDRVTLTPIRRP